MEASRSRLATAITCCLIGSMLAPMTVSKAMASNTMYNTYGAFGSNIGTDGGLYGTDGWTATSPLPNGVAEGWEPWVGTESPSTPPFGAVGDVINWAAELTAYGDSLTVSSQDAHDRYGVWANLDSAKGAWNDQGPHGPASPTAASTGWSHNTDIGLFRSTVTQQVTLRVTSLHANNGGWNNFGISVFNGSDTNSGGYNHHGQWNINYRPTSNSNPNTSPATESNPLGTVGLTYLTHTDQSEVTFTAAANQVYSILIGGYSGTGNFGPHDGYVVSISSQGPLSVPMPPGAGWLLGSVLGCLGVRLNSKRHF